MDETVTPQATKSEWCAPKLTELGEAGVLTTAQTGATTDGASASSTS
jgi:hypothetical protein